MTPQKPFDSSKQQIFDFGIITEEVKIDGSGDSVDHSLVAMLPEMMAPGTMNNGREGTVTGDEKWVTVETGSKVFVVETGIAVKQRRLPVVTDGERDEGSDAVLELLTVPATQPFSLNVEHGYQILASWISLTAKVAELA